MSEIETKWCPRCAGSGMLGAKCEWQNSTNEERTGRIPADLCDFCAKDVLHEETCYFCMGKGEVPA